MTCVLYTKSHLFSLDFTLIFIRLITIYSTVSIAALFIFVDLIFSKTQNYKKKCAAYKRHPISHRLENRLFLDRIRYTRYHEPLQRSTYTRTFYSQHSYTGEGGKVEKTRFHSIFFLLLLVLPPRRCYPARRRWTALSAARRKTNDMRKLSLGITV